MGELAPVFRGFKARNGRQPSLREVRDLSPEHGEKYMEYLAVKKHLITKPAGCNERA